MKDFRQKYLGYSIVQSHSSLHLSRCSLWQDNRERFSANRRDFNRIFTSRWWLFLHLVLKFSHQLWPFAVWRQCHLAGRTIAIAVDKVINHFDVFTLQSLISLSREAAVAWQKKKENTSVKKIVYDHANGSQIGWKIIKCEINFVFTIALAPRALEYNDDELCWRQRYGDLREFRALHCMTLWPRPLVCAISCVSAVIRWIELWSGRLR